MLQSGIHALLCVVLLYVFTCVWWEAESCCICSHSHLHKHWPHKKRCDTLLSSLCNLPGGLLFVLFCSNKRKKKRRDRREIHFCSNPRKLCWFLCSAVHLVLRVMAEMLEYVLWQLCGWSPPPPLCAHWSQSSNSKNKMYCLSLAVRIFICFTARDLQLSVQQGGSGKNSVLK